MRPIVSAGLLLVLSLATPSASGSDFGDFYVAPVAGHAAGIGGSRWQTDLVLHNFGTAPLTIEIGLVESGLGRSDNFFPVMADGAPTLVVPAGATRLLSDLLLGHRGGTAAMGALLIGGDRAFAVTSRTYNVEASGATIGQTVEPAQAFFTSPGSSAYIPGLVANTNFRSNIGFVAAAGSGAPLVLEIALTGASGASLGATTFTIAPGTISHLQGSAAAIAAAPFDVATATMRILSGPGDVTGYGSVIDNRSNHATFSSAAVPGVSTAATSSIFASFLGALDPRF